MEEILKEGSIKVEEYTMNMGLVYLIAILMIIPITTVLLSPFLLIWDYETFKVGKDSFSAYLIPIIIVAVIVHELLHGLTWGYFASKGMKAIKFGIKWKHLTPYCHCTEPLKVKHYKIGGLMPLLIMGIIPSIIGIITGHGGILALGILFSWFAGGDIVAYFMLRKLDNNVYVSDHPDKVGFIVEKEKD